MPTAAQQTGVPPAQPERATDLILIVPGMDVSRPGEALERMIDGIERYLRGAGLSGHQIATRQGEGVSQATIDLPGGAAGGRRLELRELDWTDLRPSMRDVGIYTRVWRGARLVAYWAGWLIVNPVPPTSKSLRGWMVFGALWIVLWYALVLAAAGLFVVSNVHDWLPPSGGAPAEPASTATWLTKLLSAAALALLGVKLLTDSVDVSWSSYAFMVDRDGLRRKLRLRLRGMLSHVATESDRFGRITLVAHSFGTAVAADALGAEAQDAMELPALELITLGSPLEFLACRAPRMHDVVRRCIDAPAVRSWTDFYAEEDAFCSKVPLPDGEAGKFHACRVCLGYSRCQAATGRAHAAYFERPVILDRITGLRLAVAQPPKAAL